MRSFLCCLVILCQVVAGCVSFSPKAQTEKKLALALKRAFEQEDNIPSERNILVLKGSARDPEDRIRFTHFDDNCEVILPLLRKLILQYGSDEAGFVRRVEHMALQCGTSKALCGVVRVYFDALNFDFNYTLDEPLNPKYRYSQTILDDKAIYGKPKTAHFAR